MSFVCLHDKQEIEGFLRTSVGLHIYGIGDLDDFFWPYTVWYGLRTRNRLQAIILIYTGVPLPALLAFSEGEGMGAARELLDLICPVLPRRFYTHLTPGLEEELSAHYMLTPRGTHYKMVLSHPDVLDAVDTACTVRLSPEDEEALRAFYQVSYPDNWFDFRMLETGQYFGIRADGRPVSVAGVHVFSPKYRVAALGNITTHPDHRGRGYAKAVTARLCRSLLDSVDTIGLNVAAGNEPAIRCYTSLGFEAVGSYGEFMVEARSDSTRT